MKPSTYLSVQPNIPYPGRKFAVISKKKKKKREQNYCTVSGDRSTKDKSLKASHQSTKAQPCPPRMTLTEVAVGPHWVWCQIKCFIHFYGMDYYCKSKVAPSVGAWSVIQVWPLGRGGCLCLMIHFILFIFLDLSLAPCSCWVIHTLRHTSVILNVYCQENWCDGMWFTPPPFQKLPLDLRTHLFPFYKENLWNSSNVYQAQYDLNDFIWCFCHASAWNTPQVKESSSGL